MITPLQIQKYLARRGTPVSLANITVAQSTGKLPQFNTPKRTAWKDDARIYGWASAWAHRLHSGDGTPSWARGIPLTDLRSA